MAEKNKSYRIRTSVGRDADTFLNVHLDQDYESLEVLSLKISDKDTYKLHNSDYGVIVGRVLANGNFGVPNAKISVFIPTDGDNSNLERWNLYPYTSTTTKNGDDIRYNLLPDEPVGDCHQAVGTFPHKTFLLENESMLEVFDDYYLYTTRTNASGDYLICGVPTGNHTLHMDLDLSDCGILSQRPRDFVYKGYTIEQFENPNQFKKDENIDGLSQIFSQDQPVYVQPFWGNEDNGDMIGITRADIEIAFKFEPTCVFLGSAISDNASNGISKKCVPTNKMGYMEELTTGEGTIEMIRKTPGGNVEEFSIKGNQLIDGNGVWCYQIPMNLDYMMTDEYGNMVPTDDPEKGIPTRTRVRFRVSLTDMEGSTNTFYRAKYLIPHNPATEDERDYSFGTYTKEESYRDLFWNGVYTVKSYIPRFQKSKRWKSERFSGIKACNYHSGSNPMPYNNMRIKLPFMFTVLCVFVKLFIKIVTLTNRILSAIVKVFQKISGASSIAGSVVGSLIGGLTGGIGAVAGAVAGFIFGKNFAKKQIEEKKIHCAFIGDGLCPDMEGWYFAPGCGSGMKKKKKNKELTDLLMNNTLQAAMKKGELQPMEDDDTEDKINSKEYTDETSIDIQNTRVSEMEDICLTTDVNYLVNCFEMNLAQEYRVIQFDFYNDWVNGTLYFPRWMRKIKRKKKYKFSVKNGISTYYKDKVLGCMNSNNSRVKKSRWYTQQCSLSYKKSGNENFPWTTVDTPVGCYRDKGLIDGIFPQRCHKKDGMSQSSIFGKKSGLVTEETTMLGQYVYYLKPCEWKGSVRTLLFASDIVLLGTLNDCDENGLPQAFKFLGNSSYILPTNLALTTMDDDAYIYSDKAGAVCSSSNKKTTTNPEITYTNTITGGGYFSVNSDGEVVLVTQNEQGNQVIINLGSKEKSSKKRGKEGVQRITPDYETTYNAYKTTDGDAVEYLDYDDPIPITEAAGIAWNYSGPGQDDVDGGKIESAEDLLKRLTSPDNQKRLYYPGGHFLGLSCVNSETNIKSCVNLQRICELGASMSQRREEIRGYDDKDNPKYWYYVPTGLISNVDIESATFRSMFATLNHNKLIATKTNETTGYKKYEFTFLRPDGFDGVLANYVHKSGYSPYNTTVTIPGEGDEKTVSVKDAKEFFENNFGNSWVKPEDYDPEEIEYTGRRTVEATVMDYYLFRFGLNTLNDDVQKNRFLIDKGGGRALPQYENSFYFYFGLHDGATALDEFKKQFFSECKANVVTSTPSLSVIEKINEDFSFLEATLSIENMIPGFSIKITDKTTNSTSRPFPFESENDLIDISEYITLVIGHKYLVEVTDSLDRTVTKEFTFGAGVLRGTATSVNYRCPAENGSSSPKTGGYIKINDRAYVLNQEKSVAGDGITFKFTQEIDGQEVPVSFAPGGSYVDMSGERWHLFYAPNATGNYNVYMTYNGASVLIYNTVIDDNKEINLFVGCDYVSYKPEVGKAAIFGDGLRTIQEDDWKNREPFQGTGTDNWLMRHIFYRQSANDNEPYNCYIYNKGKGSVALFGQPEKGTMASNGEVKSGTNQFVNNYSQYAGYSIESEHTFIPTMYWAPGLGEDCGTLDYRKSFDAMTYTSDGRAAADASSISITSYSYSVTDGKITMAYGGGLPDGHGCIVVFENGVMLFPIVNDSVLVAYSDFDVYPGGCTEAILEMATIYPTLMVPVIYKPFYGKVSAATWNVQTLYLPQNNLSETVPEKYILPTSYKVEGDIYNGLTWNNYFTSAFTDEGPLLTYLNFSDINEIEGWKTKDFFEALTNPETPGLETESDYNCKRKVTFGNGKWKVNRGPYGRELSALSPDSEITAIEYSITEGRPNIGEMEPNVATGRFSSGVFDLVALRDRCDLTDAFYHDIRIKALNENAGLNGLCAVYSETINNETISLRASKTALFDEEEDPLTITEGGKTYCLGTYNEKARFDKKGSVTTVEKKNKKYAYSVLQENGASVQKRAGSEGALYDAGITLLHRYTLNDAYKQNISAINVVFNEATPIEHVLAPNSPQYTPLNPGSEYKTLISLYKNPEAEGSKNELYVYKLYPIKALDLMFPGAEGGVLPYLNAESPVTFTKNEQDITIPITTNVKFSISISYPPEDAGGWATAATTIYDESATTISLHLSLNESGGDRQCTVTLQCIDPDVEIPDAYVTIIQSKDEIKPLEEEIENLKPQPPTTGGT